MAEVTIILLLSTSKKYLSAKERVRALTFQPVFQGAYLLGLQTLTDAITKFFPTHQCFSTKISNPPSVGLQLGDPADIEKYWRVVLGKDNPDQV